MIFIDLLYFIAYTRFKQNFYNLYIKKVHVTSTRKAIDETN